ARIEPLGHAQPIAHVLADALVGALVVLGSAERALDVAEGLLTGLTDLLPPALVLLPLAVRPVVTAAGAPATKLPAPCNARAVVALRATVVSPIGAAIVVRSEPLPAPVLRARRVVALPVRTALIAIPVTRALPGASLTVAALSVTRLPVAALSVARLPVAA